MAEIVTAGLAVVTMLFLAPLVAMMPQSALAGLVISSATPSLLALGILTPRASPTAVGEGSTEPVRGRGEAE